MGAHYSTPRISQSALCFFEGKLKPRGAPSLVQGHTAVERMQPDVEPAVLMTKLSCYLAMLFEREPVPKFQSHLTTDSDSNHVTTARGEWASQLSTAILNTGPRDSKDLFLGLTF